MSRMRGMSVASVVILVAVALAPCMLQAGEAAAGGHGTQIVFTTDVPSKNAGAAPRRVESVCWLPEGCAVVQGILLGGDWTAEPRFRKMATEERLATLSAGADTDWERMDVLLDRWAEASKHPEIRRVPILVVGICAGAGWTRELVYARPWRVMAMLNPVAGNLDTFPPPAGRTLSGVPYLAINAGLDHCFPDGGIRPHLGHETQWYEMGEQMLELRRRDPDHLMSTVVVPIKDHSAWNKQIAELFMRKTVKYRLPKEPGEGSEPVRCIKLRAEDGWLTHRNVQYPEHEPAAWANYRGDKLDAFWHYDEEMARAVQQYHADGKREGQSTTVFRPCGLFNRLWPLGRRMDIPFAGHSREDYAAAILKWVTAKTGADVHPIALRYLAESMAGDLVKEENGDKVDEGACRKACMLVCYAYQDAYAPIEQAIAATALPPAIKDALRTHFAEKLLLLWPHKKYMPALSIREIQAMIASLVAKSDLPAAMVEAEERARRLAMETYGAPPDSLARLIEDLKHDDKRREWWELEKDRIGWGAVEEAAKIGKPVIPELVRTMDWAGPPADFRAAAALGKMGEAGRPALPDLKQAAARGARGGTTMDGQVCEEAFKAIDRIEKGEPEAIPGPPSLKLARATFLGTGGEDDIQSACAGPDGTIYIAGNTGESAGKRLGQKGPDVNRFGTATSAARAGKKLGQKGPDVNRFDTATPAPGFGRGFVARLGADGADVLAYAEFDAGILSFATVRANEQGVYVGGYASDGLERLLTNVPCLIREYPLRDSAKPAEENTTAGDVSRSAKPLEPASEQAHAQSGDRGAPCVLRMSPDLKTIQCGTYLEGSQRLPETNRLVRAGPDPLGLPAVYARQPVGIEFLDGGDIAVAIDGRATRLSAGLDRRIAGSGRAGEAVSPRGSRIANAATPDRAQADSWTTDSAALPGNRLVAVGGCSARVTWPGDAWQAAPVGEMPVAWLSVYDDKRTTPVFTTAIRGVVPYEVSKLTSNRFIVVGTSVGVLQIARNTGGKTTAMSEEPNRGVAILKSPLNKQHRGKSDGYFMIVEWE